MNLTNYLQNVLKKLLILVFLSVVIRLQAQELKVVEFRADPSLLDATIHPKSDFNENRCGLILLGLVMPDAVFEGDIISSEYDNGEWRIYMAKGANWLNIKTKNFVPLRYEFEGIKSNVTYVMTVIEAYSSSGKPAITHQYLAFQISPPNATLFVNDEIWEVNPDGSAMKYVSFGSYNYRVQASNYLPKSDRVRVIDPDNTQIVPVALEPDFVEVTLKVNADAEIWVNNEKKGIRTWTGNLGKDTYKIECKQSGHETSMITKEITESMNGQIITLPVPNPVYGSLNIESTPNFAMIYFDGKKMGETPKSISEVLVGEHTVRLSMEGYRDYTETVLIKKGERAQMHAVMRGALETTEKNINDPIKQAKKSMWKVSWGWNIFDAYFGKDTYEMETGIRVRFGQENQMVAFIVGADIHYFLYSYLYDSDITLYDTKAKLAIPASVRLCLGNSDTQCYLGLGAILYPNFAMNINPCIAIEPQLGISSYGLMDFGVHLRYMPNEYGLIEKSKIKTMVGWYWALYLP